MHRILIALLSLALASAPSLTFAQDQLSESQQQRLVTLIEDGKAAYDKGEFETSLGLFRQAYDIYQHPDIIYRIALCHERLGEDQQAVNFYRQFLAAAPNAPERPRIEKTIEVIEARISKSEIRITTEPAGAAVFVDDEANGIAGYTPTALAVKPGNYKVIVKKDGFEPVRELVTVNAGQSVQVRYQLDTIDPVTPKKDTSGVAPSVKFVTLATVGIAAGVTSVVFFGLHGERSRKLDEFEEMRQDVPRERFEQVKRQKTTNLIVAVSAASVSAFALIWAYGTYVGERNKSRKAGLGVGWGEDGPIVTYGLTF